MTLFVSPNLFWGFLKNRNFVYLCPMPNSKTFLLLTFLAAGIVFLQSHVQAQPTWTFNPFGNEKKPEKYEEKMLGSEKTATKKFTFFRKLTQNTVSHYNYYFNANRKLNLVLEQARVSQQDDYTQLLPFYPYTLENTNSQKTELDSVIYKCTAGILLHDLRTNWVDNMYLLIGKAYYFRKEFDSAALTFQFINYNLFPRQKNEDDDRVIGEGSTQTGGFLSIANREKRSFFKRMFTTPPSRNESLIWLARTYIEQDMFGESAGLINILQHDPNLPNRLKDDLNQVTAYWHFRQQGSDSTIVYLEKALGSAETKADKARWYFLLAQLCENTAKFEQAGIYYERAASMTVDPLMEIYARLNKARMFKGPGNEKEWSNSVSNLIKLGRKDRYESYRDIIYHSAGMLAIRIPDTTQAVQLFQKSLEYNTGQVGNKNKAHLQLADIAFNQKKYVVAADHYDSLDLTHRSLAPDSSSVALRREVTKRLATYKRVIQYEDSLQVIAAMSPADRDQFLKKLSKKLRKGEPSESNDDMGSLPGLSSSFGAQNAPADLFASSSKGEWYFYNASMKSKGYNEFKAKWGKRENVDNWRRQSAMMAAINTDITDPLAPLPADSSTGDESGKPVPNSYDDLLSQIPLTAEKIDSSNRKIAQALLSMARLFEYELNDYPQALEIYEEYRARFPDSLDADLLLGLYHTHQKLGNITEANYFKDLLAKTFPTSTQHFLLTNPNAVVKNRNTPELASTYESIYQSFISGDMNKALTLKKQADSLHGDHYWTPQLLFLESAAYLKNRNDSLALRSLVTIIQRFPESPLKMRAESLIRTITQRDSLEQYLNALSITRLPDDPLIALPSSPTTQPDTTRKVALPTVRQPVPSTTPDTTRSNKPVAQPIQPTPTTYGYTWTDSTTFYLAMVLEQVDMVYIREAKLSFDQYNQSVTPPVSVLRDTLGGPRTLLVFSSFPSSQKAVTYFDRLRKNLSGMIGWLKPSQYSFIIISADNLAILKKNKNLDEYKSLLRTKIPGLF